MSRAELWLATYGPKFAVEERLFELKVFQHKNYLPDLSVEDGSGFLFAKNDPYGTLFGEPNLNRIHINSFAFQTLQDADRILSQFLERVPPGRPVVFGQDQGHFFPGVPEECPEIVSLLEYHGFSKQGDCANDLEHDLRGFQSEPGWIAPMESMGIQMGLCSEADVPALDEFLTREFPGRWHYDTVVEKCRQWHEAHDIVALWVGGTIEGFAYTQNFKTTAHPVAGWNWHLDLGSQSGALGPIGVSKRVRGQKLGGALLSYGLSHLKGLGVAQCIIDWTSLVDFYGKYGFRVNRRYQAMARPPQ